MNHSRRHKKEKKTHTHTCGFTGETTPAAVAIAKSGNMDVNSEMINLFCPVEVTGLLDRGYSLGQFQHCTLASGSRWRCMWSTFHANDKQKESVLIWVVT